MTDPRIPEKDNTGSEGATPDVIGQGAYEARSFGTLWLSWSARGLRRIVLPGGKLPYAKGEGPREMPVPSEYAKALDRYFAGEPEDLGALPIDPEGSPFQRKVWEALRRIPHGKTRSYAGIAADIGQPRATRAVGMANAKNPIPIVVPCHRVVASRHKLGGYSGGLDKKRFLLRLEGVKIEGDAVRPGQLDLL
jgi:methylated-DNA-[protein]-cysteine S-methyltransferase